MALIDSFPGASGTVDSTELRKNLAGLIVRDTAGNPRAGIFPRNANALVTSRVDMKLDVAAFEGVSVRGGGPLFMSNDGVAQSPTLPIPVANSQISILYFKNNESVAPYADADNLPIFGVISGTAAATPTPPSIAGIAGATALATITVPSTATATNSGGVVITQSFDYTATSGGVVLFRTDAARDLYVTATPGQRAYSIASLSESVWVGSGWSRVSAPGAQPFAMAAGSGSNPAGAAAAVTFPAGRFTVPPIVTMTNMGSSVSAMNAQAITASGANLGGFSTGGAAIASTWMWVAIQMTPTSAAG